VVVVFSFVSLLFSRLVALFVRPATSPEECDGCGRCVPCWRLGPREDWVLSLCSRCHRPHWRDSLRRAGARLADRTDRLVVRLQRRFCEPSSGGWASLSLIPVRCRQNVYHPSTDAIVGSRGFLLPYEDLVAMRRSGGIWLAELGAAPSLDMSWWQHELAVCADDDDIPF
jgi:hypothetical protein